MTARAAFAAFCLGLLITGACIFNPSWEAFVPCGEDGACPDGTSCWAGENLCLPACGDAPCPDGGTNAQADGGTHPDDDGGTAEPDAGDEPDGGGDDPDAGTVEDGGTTPDAGPLRLDARTLPPAIESEPYAEPITPRGGVAPCVLSQVAGEFPPGLALEGDGLEGAATTAGSYSFTLRATDSGAPPSTDDAQFAVEVVPLLRIASQPDLTSSHAGHTYQEQLQALGGSGGGLLWAVSEGAPPSGLTLNSDGLLSGTPSGGGATFEVTVTDLGTGMQVRKQQMNINVLNLGVTLHLRTRSLPHGRAGIPYEYRLVAGGTAPPYTWSLKAGSLGPGLYLQGDTVIGIPTTPGEYTATIEVMESLLSGKVSRTFTFTVY